jgi:hypothetical protein
VVIDEANQRTIEEVAGQYGCEECGHQAGAAIEGQRGERPHGGNGQDSDNGGNKRGNPFDVRRRGVTAGRDERDGSGHGVEQRRHRDVLSAWRGVRVGGQAMRKVADLVLGQPHVIPRIGLEKVDAGAAEHVVPRRPDANAGGDQQDGGQGEDVEFAHAAQIITQTCRAERAARTGFYARRIFSIGRPLASSSTSLSR